MKKIKQKLRFYINWLMLIEDKLELINLLMDIYHIMEIYLHL